MALFLLSLFLAFSAVNASLTNIAPVVAATITKTTSVTYTTIFTKTERSTATVTVTSVTSAVTTCFTSGMTLAPIQAPPSKTSKYTSSLTTSSTKPSMTPSSKIWLTTTSTLKTPTTTLTRSSLTTPTPSTTLSSTITTSIAPITTATTTITATAILSRTTTTTLTFTTTSTSLLIVPTLKPAGLNYYQYFNFVPNVPGSNISSNYYRGVEYVQFGTIQNLNSIVYDGGAITLPSQTQPIIEDSSYLALVFQGFFYAQQTGSYTFTSTNATDDWLYFWHGDVAYRTWNDTNYDYEAFFGIGGKVTLQMKEGEVMPVTILWADGNGPGRVVLDVTLPNGSTVMDTTGLFFPPCNGSNMFLP